MRARAFALALAGCETWLGLAGMAHAKEPGEGAKPASHGAIVVAIGANATGAAKPLARDVYRDEALRPANLDETTARVLVGDIAVEDVPPKLRDTNDIRSRLSHETSNEVTNRRLLASFGVEQHAEIVVAVSVVDDRAIARVMRVSTAQYEPTEIGATIARDPAGHSNVSWPGATTTLRTFVTAPPPPAPPPPIAPVKTSAAPKTPKEPPKGSSWYRSPWFWGPLGAVVAAGAAVLIASKATEDDGGVVRLRGQVAP